LEFSSFKRSSFRDEGQVFSICAGVTMGQDAEPLSERSGLAHRNLSRASPSQEDLTASLHGLSAKRIGE
jgi:hypothetical protein